MRHRRKTALALALVLASVGTLAGADARAAETRRSVLISSFEPAAGPRAPELTVRERFVRIDPPRPGEEIKLELFSDVTVEAKHERTETTGPTGSVWIGRLIGSEGRVLLSTVGGVTVGQVRTADKLYEIRYVADGVNAVNEIALGEFPNEACDSGSSSAFPEPTSPAGSREVNSDPCSVIDTMVLYTPAAKEAAGGAEAIEAEIHLAISVSNISFEDSAITTRISPVHIDEIDYVEAATQNDSGTAFDDRDALRGTTDGEMDEVHVLRDRYCADVVQVITNIGGVAPNDNWCGAAYVMDPAPDAGHEVNGFAVTRRSCAASNLSFVHEMGHLFGARHDWYVDALDTPYTYAHGYVNRAEGWRTVMAYNTECEDAFTDCPRQGVWSNPNVFIDGQPAGIPGNTQTDCAASDLSNPDCDAENWRVLNATDCTVANFRDRSVCSASEARNVWMKDTWFDTGFEPDIWTAGQDMWKSPYIWVRNSADPTGAKQHIHQNPEQGQTNYVYVKLHNDFDVPSTGQLKLYYAEASAGLVWPGDWTEFSDNTVNIAAYGTLLAPASWDPPGTGNFSLLARWTTPNNPVDLMAFAEAGSVSNNARRNNNIVWRNVNVVNLVPNVPFAVPGLHITATSPGTTSLDLAVELPDTSHNFLRAGGRILLDLGGLHDNWVATGASGSGARPIQDPVYGDVVEILDTLSGVVSLQNIRTPFGERESVHFILTAPFVPPAPPFPPQNDDPPPGSGPTGGDNDPNSELPASHFALDIVQIEAGERVGGVGYEINVEPTGGSGAVPGLLLSFDPLGNLVLEWGPSCSATDVDYSVYVGSLGDFTSHTPGACSTGGATTITWPDVPAEDSYFLVVPTDDLTEGSFGRSSSGVERQAGAAACRPQAVVTCD